MSGGLQTEFASAEVSPGMLLWRVTNRWQAAQRAALGPFGLTHVQFVLLASLTYLDGAPDGGPVTQKVLADHAATDEMMTSQVLRALEGKGLLRRDRHPRDGRARVLTVTADGAALANRAVVAVEACDREFFTGMGSRVAEFTDLLSRVSKGAGAQPPTGGTTAG